MMRSLKSDWFLYLLFFIVFGSLLNKVFTLHDHSLSNGNSIVVTDSTWYAPSLFLDNEVSGEKRELIIYGEELIAHTSKYLGPKGSVARLTNGMNCQNCHLDAGGRPWGNNYGGVASTYPRFRERSGTVESIYKRVSDCMQRSLNGNAIDSNSREFGAINAYIIWLGKDVNKGVKPQGSGIEKLPYMDRPADPVIGKIVYKAKCQSCHNADGQGQMLDSGSEYVYPPLWGQNSYNDGAGLFRISNFAGFVRNNMPFNQASHSAPQLTVQESWDVAAFVNSQPRPHKDQSTDWPNRSKKPVDFPYGPYNDPFSEQQHKFGPFAPIIAYYKQLSK